MVVSIRLNTEAEQRYRDYAASQGMTISQFMRKAADDVIAQADLLVLKAEEERRHREEVEDFKRRMQALRTEFLATANPQVKEQDVERMRIERHA